MLAQSVIDSAQVEWLFAHWLDLATVGVIAALGWRYRGKIGSLLSSSPATVDDAKPAVGFDEADYRPELFDALCLIHDHCEAIQSTEGIAACKTLAVLVTEKPPEPTTKE